METTNMKRSGKNRLIAIILAVMLMSALAACGETEQPGGTDSTGQSTETTQAAGTGGSDILAKDPAIKEGNSFSNLNNG